MPSPEQIQSSLARANECKQRRYQLAQEIKAGEVKVSDLLREPTLPDWLKGEPVDRLLRRIPRFGPRRTTSLLNYFRVSHRRPVGELTYRQRRQLAAKLALEEGRWSPTVRRARPHWGSTAGPVAGGGV
jgi:hypothetical protein